MLDGLSIPYLRWPNCAFSCFLHFFTLHVPYFDLPLLTATRPIPIDSYRRLKANLLLFYRRLTAEYRRLTGEQPSANRVPCFTTKTKGKTLILYLTGPSPLTYRLLPTVYRRFTACYRPPPHRHADAHTTDSVTALASASSAGTKDWFVSVPSGTDICINVT